jgi:hypothetical protein
MCGGTEGVRRTESQGLRTKSTSPPKHIRQEDTVGDEGKRGLLLLMCNIAGYTIQVS